MIVRIGRIDAGSTSRPTKKGQLLIDRKRSSQKRGYDFATTPGSRIRHGLRKPTSAALIAMR